MATRILVPLDGSSLAEQALSTAVTLARGLESELLLLRAVWIPPEALSVLNQALVDPNQILDEMESEADGYLQAVTGKLAAAGVGVQPLVRRGPAADAILECAQELSADGIVMATHGYSGFRRWTHGSVAERVLQAAPMPLLLVRAREEGQAEDWVQPKPFRRILVPLDGSAIAEQILPAVTTAAAALQAGLVLFQVPIAQTTGWLTGEWSVPVQGVLDTAERDAERYLGSVAARLEAKGLAVTTATSLGGVAECIIEYAETNEVDLVAMCTHGRTGLVRWALGSVADRVLRAGSTPILLVRAQ